MSCICGYLHFTRDLQYEFFYLSQYILQFIKSKKNSKYGDKYTSNKYNKSIDLVKHMTFEDLNVLDLKERIEQIVLQIKKWNYIQ